MKKGLSCNVLAKKWHFGRFREKIGYPIRFDRKLFSCKILAELVVILQDPRKNGCLGKLWQKEEQSFNNLLSCRALTKLVNLRDFLQKECLSCNNLTKKSYLARFWQKRVIQQDSAKEVSFHKNQVEILLSSKNSVENCYLVRFWQNEWLSCETLTKWLSWKILTERMAILQVFVKKWLFYKIMLEKGYLARLWQNNVISGESGRNLVILHDSTENCSLARFWQNELLSCKTLTKMVILENSDRKNGYLAIIWQKMVLLQDSGEKRVILQCSGKKKCHFGRIREKFGYPAWFDRKLFSCKVLAEWMDILQDADKNGYLGKIWQKEWLSCINLAKNGSFTRF